MSHTSAVGADKLSEKEGVTWVARSHEIEYLRPLFEGETVRIDTWIDDVQRASCTRHYSFKRASDAVEVARGRTKWVCIDVGSGRPRAIPDDLLTAFQGQAAE